MSNQKELKKIKEIDQKITLQIDKIFSQNKKIRVLIEDRNKLNIKCKKLRQDIRVKKDERDELNSRVKTLKKLRNGIQIELKKKVENIKKYREKINFLREKFSNKKIQNLKKEFDEIEWKIQTSILELNEEKRLVEQVKNLGTQINIYKKIENNKIKTIDLRKNIKKNETEANKTHEELTALANKSQELHSLILLKVDELKKTKEKADQIHISYLDIKKLSLPLRKKKNELIQKKRKLLNSIKEKEDKKRRESENNLKIKIKTEAQTKIKNKEKLSWNEFKLLTESNNENNK